MIPTFLAIHNIQININPTVIVVSLPPVVGGVLRPRGDHGRPRPRPSRLQPKYPADAVTPGAAYLGLSCRNTGMGYHLEEDR